MGDREEKLANFQACTGMEDIETAISTLEFFNWDLKAAVGAILDVDEETVDMDVRDSEDAGVVEPSSDLYILLITLEPSGREVVLELPGSTSIARVKEVLFEQTGLPPASQKWKGWPKHVKGTEVILAESGLSLLDGTQRFQVFDKGGDRCDTPTSSERDGASSGPSRADDVLDSLIPEDVLDASKGTELFLQNFRESYGKGDVMLPPFYVGSLQDAVRTTLLCPVSERRPLVVYLHHSGNPSTEDACLKVLCSPTFISLLVGHDAVLWPWDLSLPNQRAVLLTWLAEALTQGLAENVEHMQDYEFPAFVVAWKAHSDEAMRMITCLGGPETVIDAAYEVLALIESSRVADFAMETAREARERELSEQNAEYQESLRKDQLKERSRQEEAEDSARRAKLEQLWVEREAEELEKRQSQAARIVPEEPALGQEKVASLRLRLPGGDTKLRRFAGDATLEGLLAYIESLGYLREKFKLLTTYPVRDLTSQPNHSLTLAELKLVPQETLILEEKD